MSKPPELKIVDEDYVDHLAPERQLNGHHLDFVQQCQDAGLEADMFAGFLTDNCDQTLYDLIEKLRRLSSVFQARHDLEHATVLAEHIANLYNVCQDAFKLEAASSDKADFKIQSQLEILDEDILSAQQQGALLGVLEQHSAGINGLDLDNGLETAKLRETLQAAKIEAAANVVFSIEKARQKLQKKLK